MGDSEGIELQRNWASDLLKEIQLTNNVNCYIYIQILPWIRRQLLVNDLTMKFDPGRYQFRQVYRADQPKDEVILRVLFGCNNGFKIRGVVRIHRND